MPLIFQQDINGDTRLGVWRISEPEDFFLGHVPLHSEITHPHKRLQHLAGRYLLRHLFPDFPYGLIRIADTRRPFVEDDLFHFSISHCGDTAAAIVSRSTRVGIDAEDATPRVMRILRKFLHEEERAWLSAAMEADSAHDVHALPTMLWSAKESVYKWYGSGQVDFSEHIRISPFRLEATGAMAATFRKGATVDLSLFFRYRDGLCLSWIHQPLP